MLEVGVLGSLALLLGWIFGRIGGIPLSLGLAFGELILAISASAILVTAPLGAVGIRKGAPLLLEKEALE